MSRDVLVVNTSMPELDLLAAELDRRAALGCYLRRYWTADAADRSQAGRFSSRLGKHLARRRLEAPITPSRIQSAGVALDFLAAGINRLGPNPGLRGLGYRLIRLRNRVIAARGARLSAGNPTTVVANQGSALPAFRAMRAKGGRTVLNYPSADYRTCKRIVEEERQLEPEFAASLQFHFRPRLADRLDAECAAADCILTGSGFAARTLAAAGQRPDHIAVAPFGVDPEVFHPPPERRPRQDRFRVLFVGRIGQAKGIAYLLRAYRKLSGPGTSLTLVGHFVGPVRPFVPYLPLLRHIGFTPHSLLPDRYAEADVFVFPTLFEGMGLVVLEAMACGLPVVTTTHGPNELVRDGIEGFTLPIRDVDALTQRMTLLRDDPELRIRMGLAARRRALQFTWDRYARQAADLVLTRRDPS